MKLVSFYSLSHSRLFYNILHLSKSHEDLESGEDIGSTSITAHTATVMSNIGRVYFMFGEFEKSLYYSQDCLGRRLLSLPRNDLDLAISSFNVNQTTKSLGENQKR